jgi:hypothetical protein
MSKLSTCFAVLASAVLVVPGVSEAQDLAKESLESFPPQTIRVEYASPAKLRMLPNYARLRQRYIGSRLRALEKSFAQLGVGEDDIDEVVLGWQPGTDSMKLAGIVVGRFTAKAIADQAGSRGIQPAMVGELPGYCLGGEGGSTCLVVLRDSLGIFGAQDVVAAMLEARAGQAPSLISYERFARLIRETQTDAPIWGVAIGEAVPDWIRAWMPAQGNLQMDWAKAFQSVEALVYSVETGDKVRLNVRMDCATSQAAASTRQVLEGLKLFQQMAWRNMSPNQPNPFETVEITSSDLGVTLKMTTSYADLEGPGMTGGPGG